MSNDSNGVGKSGSKQTLSVPGEFPHSDSGNPNPAAAPFSLLEAIGSCIDGDNKYLSQLYKHFRPDHILDELASHERFPDELKLLVLEEFVKRHRPSIFLRDRKDLDNIVDKELRKGRSTTKKPLKPILEEALLTTSVVGLDIDFQHRILDGKDYFVGKIPEDLRELKSRIRHLELRHYMEVRPYTRGLIHAPCLLSRVEAGMSFVQSQFPGLHGLDVHVYVITDLLEKNEDAAAWLDVHCHYRPDSDSFYDHMTARILIAQALEAAYNWDSETRKDAFKLSLHQLGASPAEAERVVQTEAVDLRTVDDFEKAVGESLATAKDAKIDDSDMDTTLNKLSVTVQTAWSVEMAIRRRDIC